MDWLTVDLGPGVTAHVTTRAGGVSTGPYASLDLAYHVGDDETAVAQNRERLESALGTPVVYANQVHGSHAEVVGRVPGPGARHVADADALVTSVPGLALAVLVADCLPILLADAGARVAAAVHVGRRGLLDGALPAAVRTMVSEGATPGAIAAYVGPGICGACYEVGPDVQARAAAVLPGVAGRSRWGTPSVDLQAGALGQLAGLGVREVRTAGLCTVEDHRFYSYRRSGRTGRFAGVVCLEQRDTP